MWHALRASTGLIGPPPIFFWMIPAIMALVAVFAAFVGLRAPGQHDTPDRCWKAGIFYVNPDDHSLFVPKRFGIGYTINFGHPWSGVVLAVIIVIALVPVILALFVLHRTFPPHP